MEKLNAKELRKKEANLSLLNKIKRAPVYLVLDEINDTYNIGSLFRLADAVAVKKSTSAAIWIFPILANPQSGGRNRKLGALGKKRNST